MSRSSRSRQAWIRNDYDLELDANEDPGFNFTTISLVGESTWESNPNLQQEKALLVRTILDISYIWFSTAGVSAANNELENISGSVFVTDDDQPVALETAFFETQQVMDAWVFGGWTTALAINGEDADETPAYYYVYTGMHSRNITVKRRLVKDQFLALSFQTDAVTTGPYKCNIRVRASTLIVIP